MILMIFTQFSSIGFTYGYLRFTPSVLRNGHEISPHFVSGMERSGFPETTQNREIIS